MATARNTHLKREETELGEESKEKMTHGDDDEEFLKEVKEYVNEPEKVGVRDWTKTSSSSYRRGNVMPDPTLSSFMYNTCYMVRCPNCQYAAAG
jgi:hypothetical protein